MSEAHRILGWDSREIEFEGSTLADLLRSLATREGESLYSYLIEENRIKAGYIVSVNGQIVTSLETLLQSGDRVMTMDVVRLFHGG